MTETHPSASRGRRLLFLLLTMVLIVIGCELLSLVGLRFALGGWDVRIRLHTQRQATWQERTGWEPDQQDDPAGSQVSYVLHPYLGFVLDSGHHWRLRRKAGGQDALDFGFKLSEPGLFHRREPGTLIVAVTGGSVAMELASRGSELLRNRLIDTFPDIDRVVVVNLALPGFKQPQQLIALNYLFSLGATFDVVVNLDGYNEIALPPTENIPMGVFPFFPRAWFFRSSEFDTKTRLAVAELTRIQRKRLEIARRFDRQPWRSSLTLGVLWRLLDLNLARSVAIQETALAESTTELSFTASGPPRKYPNGKVVYRQLAAAWARSSQLMNSACRVGNCLYLHFLQPNQYVPDSKRLTQEELANAFDPDLRTKKHVERGYGFLRKEGARLKKRGIAFYDLTRVFEASLETDYRDFCCHLTSTGEAKVIDAIRLAIAKARTENPNPKPRAG